MNATGSQSAILRVLEERGPCTPDNLMELLSAYPTDEVVRAVSALRRNGTLIPWHLSKTDRHAAVVKRPNPSRSKAEGQEWETSRSTNHTPVARIR